eukprot:Clim_evm239s157 gene=Clim_evmTU239s157
MVKKYETCATSMLCVARSRRGVLWVNPFRAVSAVRSKHARVNADDLHPLGFGPYKDTKSAEDLTETEKDNLMGRSFQPNLYLWNLRRFHEAAQEIDDVQRDATLPNWGPFLQFTNESIDYERYATLNDVEYSPKEVRSLYRRCLKFCDDFEGLSDISVIRSQIQKEFRKPVRDNDEGKWQCQRAHHFLNTACHKII